MIVLFIGDIVGKSSREKVKQNITNLRKKYSPDVIIANAENATSGYGLSKKDAEDLLQSGIDILTLGNHAWDQREMLSFIEECPKIVRAINFPPGVERPPIFTVTPFWRLIDVDAIPTSVSPESL